MVVVASDFFRDGRSLRCLGWRRVFLWRSAMASVHGKRPLERRRWGELRRVDGWKECEVVVKRLLTEC